MGPFPADLQPEYTDDPAKAAAYMGRYEKLKGCLMLAEGYQEVQAGE